MKIDYDVGLELQRFSESGLILKGYGAENVAAEENYLLGEIRNPVAALDVKALEKIPNGGLISHLFSNPKIKNISSYDGSTAEWLRLKETWPVTIDTVVHLEGQRAFEPLSKAENVLAIASGSGITGIYAANNHPNIRKLTFSDISPNAIITSTHNQQYIQRLNLDVQSNVGDGFENISEKYDVIIAGAVPSTPGYPGLKRPLNLLFEGTDLLEKILRDSPRYLSNGGTLLISHSSCGEAEFNSLAKKYGASVKGVIFQRENAFRTEFLGDSNWVDFLVDSGGLLRKSKKVPIEKEGVTEYVDSGHNYWHNVAVKEVRFD